MGPQLKMLLWKEWRERWDQALYCLAWVLGAAISSVWGHYEFVVVCSMAAFPYCVLMPILVGMRTAQGEQTDHSLAFSLGLPANPTRQAAIRLAGGWLALVVPVVIGGVISAVYPVGHLQYGPIPISSGMHWAELVAAIAVVASLASGLYLLVCVVGTWVQSEMRLGLAAVVLAIVYWLNFLLGVFLSKPDSNYMVLRLCTNIISFNAFVIVGGPQDPPFGRPFPMDSRSIWNIWAPLALNTLVQCSLAILFVRRYGRPRSVNWDGAGRISRRRTLLTSPALRSTNLALGWLTLRQTLPLCLPGLAIICLIVFGAAGLAGQRFLQTVGQAFAPVSAIIGVLWAVIVGAGVFSDEIDSRIGESWRAWPLSVGRFFIIKYLVGLLAVLVVLDGPVLVLDGTTTVANTPPEFPTLGYLAYLVPLHATLFSLAVAASCLLRRSTLAALAALTVYLFVICVLVGFQIGDRYEPISLGGRFDSTSIDPAVVGVMVLTTLASAVVGYLAFARGGARGAWLWAADRLARAGSHFQPAAGRRLS